MDQSKPPRGNFFAFLNRDKEPGDKLPAFVNGRIAKPGDKEEYAFALWPFEYTHKATGELRTGFSGRMGELPIDADAHQQIEAAARGKASAPAIEGPGNLKLDPGVVVLFVSTPKDGSAADKPKDYYGYANFGDGSSYVDLSVWVSKDRYGKAMISGNSQYPLDKQSDQPTIEALVDEGRIARGMPDKRKGRGGRE